jgi:hypothetical protein
MRAPLRSAAAGLSLSLRLIAATGAALSGDRIPVSGSSTLTYTHQQSVEVAPGHLLLLGKPRART